MLADQAVPRRLVRSITFSLRSGQLGFQLGPARHLSSLKIRQKSLLCINPGMRRHARDPNGERLGVFEMMGDFVEERAEKFFHRATAVHAVVGVNPHEAAAIGSSPQGRGWSAVN